LFGTGKIGHTCENLVKHTKTNITLINRTKDGTISWKLNLIVKDYSELHLELQKPT
jgi:glutamyl-tRNA reductase